MAPKKSNPKWRYGCILDAGSSGTRIYVYRWHDPDFQRAKLPSSELSRLPEIKTKKKWIKKIHPGISSFADRLHDVGEEHLRPLFEHALEVIPADAVESTPIFLLATAGVRLLPEGKRSALLNEVCQFAQKNTKFLLPDCSLHIQAITGETEGLYGWIATNYLVGSFDHSSEHDHGKGHHTYGFLDMGGASAQIAFAPNATETSKHVNELKFLRLRQLSGKMMEYRVFVKTWLGFGARQARTRYISNLIEASGGPDITELPDPCLHQGVKVTVDGKRVDDSSGKSQNLGTTHLLGTGKFDECQRQVHSLLSTTKNKPCDADACLLDADTFPKIDFDVNHFLGVSEYWHTTHEIFEFDHSVKSYDMGTYSKRVQEFCSKDWASVETAVRSGSFGKKVDADTAMEVCFKASWVINMLHAGIGIPRIGIETTGDGHNSTEKLIEGARSKGFLDPFQAVDKIQETEVSWTLGKMVLYASSMVPPVGVKPGPDLPVGFGTNSAATEKGETPADFEYASETMQKHPDLSGPSKVPSSGETVSDASPSQTADADNAKSDEASRLSALWGSSTTSRRLPGLILIFLMIGLAAYLLLGKDRRSRMYRRLSDCLPCFRSSKGKRKVIGSSGGVAYERVWNDRDLEAGDMNDFELDGFEDDDNTVGLGNEYEGRRGSTRRMKSHLDVVDPGSSSSSRSRDVSPLRGAGAGRRVKSPMPRVDTMG